MRNITILLGILLLVAASLFLFFNAPTQKRNTNQSTPLSQTPIPVCEALHVVTPTQESTIHSPFIVEVIVDNSQKNCHWTVFEAQAGRIELKDEKGTVLGNGTLLTTEDWMKEAPTRYTGRIIFTKPINSTKATLVITEENPSGKPDTQTITTALHF